MKKWSIRIVLLSVLAASSYYGWEWWQSQQPPPLPDGIVHGNGRMEAVQVDIATKYAGRVKDVLVREGDLVEAGQLLAKMDTLELEAKLTQSQAEIAEAEEAVAQAKALVVERQSELKLAESQLKRSARLVESKAASREELEQRQSQREVAEAAVAAAKASQNTATRSVDAESAAAEQIKVQLDDAVLTSPTIGRVLYRLSEIGEVLSTGGKVLTLVNLSDVYMEVFLPSAQAHRIAIGAEARVKLDILDFAIPAAVSFVSPESQFTPKQVETPSEREKLMFRVKVRIPQELVLDHIAEVKTGVRGVAYIQLTALPGEEPSPWPEFLRQLPPDVEPAAVNSN